MLTKTQTQSNQAYWAKNIENKVYHCTSCDKSYRDQYTYNRHLRSMKHNPDRYKTYRCETCNYSSKIKTAYNVHMQCRKHIKNSPQGGPS